MSLPKRKKRTQEIVAYLRVSTGEQAESQAGLNAQRDAIAKWAGELPVRYFSDEGISGAAQLHKRPGLLDALNAVGRDGILLVAKRDRLSRDPLQLGMVEQQLKRKGARVVSAAGEGTENDDPASVLLRRMVDSFAEYERLMIAARTRAALQAKKARGERVGQIPLGYRLDSVNAKLLAQEPAEQQALRRIIQLREQGQSVRAIATTLTLEGVPTKTGRGRWNHRVVHKIVQRMAESG